MNEYNVLMGRIANIERILSNLTIWLDHIDARLTRVEIMLGMSQRR